MRIAAVLYGFQGLAFGASVPVVVLFLVKNGHLPTMFGFRALGGPFEDLGRSGFIVVGGLLVLVSWIDVLAAVLMWRGKRKGAVLGLATDPIALVLGWGFALPLLLIGVPLRAIAAIAALRGATQPGPN